IPLLSCAACKMFDTDSRVSKVLGTVLQMGAPWAEQKSSSGAPTTFSFSTNGPSKLPVRFITEASVAFYATRKTGLLRAIPNIDMMTRAIEIAYSHSPSQSVEVVNRSHALVYAFVAFCSLAGHSQEISYPVDGKALLMEAKRLSSDGESSPSSFESLQVSLLLVRYVLLVTYTTQALCHCLLGALLEARETVSIIASQLTELAINNHFFESSPEGLPSNLDAETEYPDVLRDLLWISLMVDNEIFLRTGHPPLILAKFATAAALPCEYQFSSQFLSRFLPARGADPRADVYIYMADLTLHVSRLYISLYAPEAISKSSVELLQTIISLDNQLEEWRRSIPQSFRPTIHVLNLPTNSLRDIDLLLLNLKFHHILGCIHQVVNRCQSWAGETATFHEALESSLRPSLQASVSSLELLRATQVALNPEMFWFICFYLFSAHLNLFCNVVASPCDPQNHARLQILQSSPAFLRCIDTCHLTRVEVEQLSVLVEFCTDLVTHAEHEVAAANSV
ncbi:fungal specific transcription factor domain-containing protein, partial [Aspergillus homomorphus CBS 101889]